MKFFKALRYKHGLLSAAESLEKIRKDVKRYEEHIKELDATAEKFTSMAKASPHRDTTIKLLVVVQRLRKNSANKRVLIAKANVMIHMLDITVALDTI